MSKKGNKYARNAIVYSWHHLITLEILCIEKNKINMILFALKQFFGEPIKISDSKFRILKELPSNENLLLLVSQD